MKIRPKCFYCLILMGAYFAGLFIPLGGAASARPFVAIQSKHSTSGTALADGHTTILVQDMSGSMESNDPDNIRCSAANAYIDLSSNGDTVGVVKLAGEKASRLLEPTVLGDNNRNQLKKQLNEQCIHNGATPTYSALKLTLDMLTEAASNGQKASAILLTDGDPDPVSLVVNNQSQTQDNLIRQELLPKFASHHWPIDTIALGEDIQNPALLRDTARLTGGKSYATNGSSPEAAVQGNSPLNIAPFFLKILADRKGQQLNQVVPPTPIPYQRNFTVSDQAKQYTMIALKDNSDAKITLKTKGGVVISAANNGNGISYSEDPHYVILSMSPVNVKDWVIATQGSGKFLMYDFSQSSLGVNIIDPSSDQTLPLNQPIPITVQLLTDKDTALQAARGSYNLYCFLQQGNHNIATLQLERTPAGQYSGSLSAATDAAGHKNSPGNYTLHVEVRYVAGGAIVSQDRSYTFDFFPEPHFIDNDGHKYTTIDKISQTTARWPDQIQLLSHLPAPLTWLPSLANDKFFADTPLNSQAFFMGDLESEGKIFASGQVSSASALLTGSQKKISVPVSNDNHGHFSLDFSHLPQGTYNVELTTAGNLGGTWKGYELQLKVNEVPQWKQWVVGAIFLLNILLIFFLVVLIFRLARYPMSPSVTGGYELVPDMHFPFDGRDSLFKWFRQRNRLRTPHALRDSGPGLELIVNNNNSGKIVVRRKGPGSHNWFDLNGDQLDTQFKSANGVIYSLDGQPRAPGAKIYRFETRGGRALPPMSTNRKASVPHTRNTNTLQTGKSARKPETRTQRPGKASSHESEKKRYRV